MSETSLEGLTLHVADLQRSLDFYCSIPGARVLFERPGQFAMLQIGNGRLGLLQHGSGFHVEIEAANLDEIYVQVRQAGLEPQSPPTVRPWGERDFLVTDPDGNLIEFGEAHASLQHG
jgi:catechol 2,3-dioxygenase-like lactoylglutathione lyase family enzyme